RMGYRERGGVSPGGAVVGSQGRQPLDPGPALGPAPEGRQCLPTPRGTVAPPGLVAGGAADQGLAPLATDYRPSGAKAIAVSASPQARRPQLDEVPAEPPLDTRALLID